MNTDFLDKLLDFIKIIWLIILSVLAPIKVAILVLMFFFLLNFFVGFKNDEIVHKNAFSLKKAFEAVRLLILYYAIIFIVNLALSLFQEIELAESATKFITWIVCYWYLVNILRNAKEIFPSGKGLQFMYNLMTVEILNVLLMKFGFNPRDYEDKKEN